MAKIYISSTFQDLKEYRSAAYGALRKLGHDVISMEDYSASSERPLEKCLNDVARCDVYVGIFAWRYGFVPPGKKKSITELECEHAVIKKKECLFFLLDDDSAWKKNLIDSNTAQIDKLREKLKKDFVVEFFANQDDLATRISIAVAKASIAARTLVSNGAVNSDQDDNDKNLKQVVRILSPVIFAFLAIVIVTVLAMVLIIAVPSMGVDLRLAVPGLGSVFALMTGCLMLTINKVVTTVQNG